MESMSVEEMNMKAYMESAFRAAEEECPAWHRSEQREGDEDVLRHEQE